MSLPEAGCDLRCVAELLIGFWRPSSMTVSEVRAWLVDRALVRSRALALSVPEASVGQQGLRLRVELDDSEVETAEEELADLMMDMRLLGLRPAVLTSENGSGGQR
jgi:hypothetical protein